MPGGGRFSGGERMDDTPTGRHGGAAVAVGLGYFALSAFIIYAVVNANR